MPICQNCKKELDYNDDYVELHTIKKFTIKGFYTFCNLNCLINFITTNKEKIVSRQNEKMEENVYIYKK